MGAEGTCYPDGRGQNDNLKYLCVLDQLMILD